MHQPHEGFDRALFVRPGGPNGQRGATLRGQHQDRCVLYVFRCAVYFATEPAPEPERLKWWNWMDTDSTVPNC